MLPYFAQRAYLSVLKQTHKWMDRQSDYSTPCAQAHGVNIIIICDNHNIAGSFPVDSCTTKSRIGVLQGQLQPLTDVCLCQSLTQISLLTISDFRAVCKTHHVH